MCNQSPRTGALVLRGLDAVTQWEKVTEEKAQPSEATADALVWEGAVAPWVRAEVS